MLSDNISTPKETIQKEEENQYIVNPKTSELVTAFFEGKINLNSVYSDDSLDDISFHEEKYNTISAVNNHESVSFEQHDNSKIEAFHEKFVLDDVEITLARDLDLSTTLNESFTNKSLPMKSFNELDVDEF